MPITYVPSNLAGAMRCFKAGGRRIGPSIGLSKRRPMALHLIANTARHSGQRPDAASDRPANETFETIERRATPTSMQP
jgi:hypothetical protein